MTNEEIIEVHYKGYILKVEEMMYNFGDESCTDYRAYCQDTDLGFVLDWSIRRLDSIINEFKEIVNKKREGKVYESRGYLAENGEIVYYKNYITSTSGKTIF